MPIATTADARSFRGRMMLDGSWLAKLAFLILLVVLADGLFFLENGGSTLGLYAAAVLLALVATRPALLRSRLAFAAAGAAVLFALALAWDRSVLALLLFWTSVSMAALLPRIGRFGDAWEWLQRLAVQGLRAVAAPILDLQRFAAARRRRGSARIVAAIPLLILPAAGTIVFLALFAAANPLIERGFGRINLGLIFAGLSLGRIFFWGFVALPLWALLRARPFRPFPLPAGTGDLALPGVNAASVTLSLLAFNFIFALQNGLDLAFLWSGAPLPDGMTLAGYAHRGAYPLIVTALLAGLFVLVTLRPGSALAESLALRRLVYLWIAQNVLLVASTALRTIDYVEAYSLTRLRIAALIWMALVAIGLVLLCWRIGKGRSGAWLINANCAAAALALTACSFADLGTIAAAWNVRHAREAGGTGQPLDICYMAQLGPSALLPLLNLERRPLAPHARERVVWVRNLILDRMEPRQANWREWTAHDAWRLSRAHAEIAAARLPRSAAARRSCFEPAPAALTPAPRR